MRLLYQSLIVVILFLVPAFAQVPVNTGIQILKSEDTRRFDSVLLDLIKSPDTAVRSRAALAAGRIGDEKAVPVLADLMETDKSTDVRAMAAFALGEIESINAADAIVKALQDPDTSATVRARAVEAAGKIAAANAKDPKAAGLGKAILETLKHEDELAAKQNRDVVLEGITAALRARPDGADEVVARSLTNADARIRADAANTLTRLRAKNANETLRQMLAGDKDAAARANAARALGAADDKEAVDVLLKAATEDIDPRVRVSAIRSLASLKDAKAADKLVGRGEKLLAAFKASKLRIPNEKNEILEICVALGRLLTNSDDARAVKFITEFARLDNAYSSEITIARVRISQVKGDGQFPEVVNWRQYVTIAQLAGEFADLEPVTDNGKKFKSEAPDVLRLMAKAFAAVDPKTEGESALAAPDVLRAYAKFKTADLTEILLEGLKNSDVFIRTASAELLAVLPPSKDKTSALNQAFSLALTKDKDYDDAQLAILDALFKLDKNEAVESLVLALSSPDYLVRKKAFDLLSDDELQKKFPALRTSVEKARTANKDQVLPYSPAAGTKLGQVLNSDADYRRALSRKNGTVKAVLTTEKGMFTIDLLSEDAPLTVDNFIKLARSNYFNGVEVHRVVPNFVMQDGDPRGDGNGGPGWSIRCEINMVPYDRGAVGMALSGKDTGGSQWFVTHSPQPHLDGGYTVFGRVNETDMRVVDNIVRGDKIISVKIIDGTLPPRTPITPKQKH